jgi:hemolysin activation/secretion protein
MSVKEKLSKSASQVRCLLKSLSSILAICLSASVTAQSTIPDSSSELQRQKRQRQELRERFEVQPWSPSWVAPQILTLEQLPDELPCVVVDQVVINGPIFSHALQTALSGVNGNDPPYGRCLGGQGVTLLIQRVQQVLVEQGYITSHVNVAAQDLNSGELVLQVNEGRVARITRNPGESAENGKEPLPRFVWAVREGRVLNLRDIEQTSDNLQRLLSLRSKIQIEPGEAPGTSDLSVELNASRPLRLGWSMDDGGTRSTGKLQTSFTLTWDNPLGLGDLFYLTKGQDLGGKERGPRGSSNQITHYSLPWGYWLIGVTFSDNKYNQTVYGPFESYLYSGKSSYWELSLSRVLNRNAISKTSASLKGFERQSNNYIADLEVLVQR